jgi:DNA polymerase-1|tara:strand:+ start:82 stop:1017 length:936 start_codon:yes stop_codon:yes gene_type:complete
VSGRYGSDAQQLPKPLEEGEDAPIIMKYVNIVRAFLTAGDGRKVIDADYESLEPHCFASVTGDENLREIFRKGWDFYSTVAIQTENLKGVSADKKADNYLKKLDPIKRNKAKAYSLGIAYGMEAYALKMTLGVDQKEAERLIKGYLDGFPQLAEWRERSREQVKAYGRITNYVGRIRHLPRVKQYYEKFDNKLMDWRFRKTLESTYGKEKVIKAYRDFRNGLNNCLNFQLQSLAAAVVNRAALVINRKAKELGIDACVQAQVHDQLIINCDKKDVAMFAPIVQDIMETTTVLPGVTLKAPPEISDNWKDGH